MGPGEGNAQKAQSERRKQERKFKHDVKQPGYNKLVTGQVGGKFYLGMTRSLLLMPAVSHEHQHQNITISGNVTIGSGGSFMGGVTTTTTNTNSHNTCTCGAGAAGAASKTGKGPKSRSYNQQKADAKAYAIEHDAPLLFQQANIKPQASAEQKSEMLRLYLENLDPTAFSPSMSTARATSLGT